MLLHTDAASIQNYQAAQKNYLVDLLAGATHTQFSVMVQACQAKHIHSWTCWTIFIEEMGLPFQFLSTLISYQRIRIFYAFVESLRHSYTKDGCTCVQTPTAQKTAENVATMLQECGRTDPRCAKYTKQRPDLTRQYCGYTKIDRPTCQMKVLSIYIYPHILQ